jgi:hypothetical protein
MLKVNSENASIGRPKLVPWPILLRESDLWIPSTILISESAIIGNGYYDTWYQAPDMGPDRGRIGVRVWVRVWNWIQGWIWGRIGAGYGDIGFYLKKYESLKP